MLPSSVRMRSGDDFTRTVRRGSRFGTKTVVLHSWSDRPTTPDRRPQGPLVGFVVSKSVGNAVRRNRVKRRLRHLVADRLAELPDQARLVVRALPAAATEPARVPGDLEMAWSRAARQWADPADRSEQRAEQPR